MKQECWHLTKVWEMLCTTVYFAFLKKKNLIYNDPARKKHKDLRHKWELSRRWTFKINTRHFSDPESLMEVFAPSAGGRQVQSFLHCTNTQGCDSGGRNRVGRYILVPTCLRKHKAAHLQRRAQTNPGHAKEMNTEVALKQHHLLTN